MTYEIYTYIYLSAAILCGVMLIVSALIFVLFKIPRVIGDLSGSTAKKAIKNIREQNEQSGDKAYKVSAYNRDRGKITDRISDSNSVDYKGNSQMSGIHTSKISTQNLTAASASSETVVLQEDNAAISQDTVVLTEEYAAMPQRSGETEVLAPSAYIDISQDDVPDGIFDPVFKIEYDITFIHTAIQIVQGE